MRPTLESVSAGLELVVFVGLQGAGKSTFFRARFAATHVHVSKDEFRNNRNRERRQRVLVSEALDAGRSVVVDNTNASRGERAGIIAIARDRHASIHGYVFEYDVALSMARNSLREGRERVAEVGLYATAKRWEEPMYAEGFDALYRVIARDGIFAIEPWERGRDGR